MTTAEASYLSSGHDWRESLDSLEGVPDFVEPRQQAKAEASGHPIYRLLNWIGTMLPGVCLALFIAWICSELADYVGAKAHYRAGASPLSPVTLAVVLGLAIRNTIGVPKAYEAGLKFCLRTVLRIGIVIMGLTLSIVTVGQNVMYALPVMIGCITVAMLSVTFISRAVGIPRRLGTLIAVGTSICGVSAIMATAPVIEADENETSYAAACITIFGVVAMITYPFIGHGLFHYPMQAGMFFGTAIHDMSQATGAGLAYSQTFEPPKMAVAATTAVSVKLVRNLFMSLLIPLAGVLYHRGKEGNKRVQQKWHQIVPLFVLGFLAMACLRSFGDTTVEHSASATAPGIAFGLVSKPHWDTVGETAKILVPWLLAMAMAAVGLGTGFAKLKNLGIKPFTVGFAAALLVGVVSASLIYLVTPLMHLGR